MRLHILPILLLMLPAFETKAQIFDEKDFTPYTSGNGLSHNRVHSIVQDEYGYLWIATHRGLNRFDGNSFLRFYSDTSQNSLANDHVKKLRWLNKNELSAATQEGLHIIQPGNLLQRNIIIPASALNQPHIENHIQGMAGDETGNVFLLSSTGFFHFYKNELVFRYDHFKKEDAGKTDVPFGRSDGVIMPEPGLLIVATTAGPFIYRIATKAFHPVTEKDGVFYSGIAPGKDWIHFMHCDEESFSVISEGAKELAWFDKKKKKKYLLQTSLHALDQLFGWRSKITRINDSTFAINAMQKGFYLIRYHHQTDHYEILPELYLPEYLCISIFKDRQHRLWIGTDRGLLRHQKNAGNLIKLALPSLSDQKKPVTGVSCFTASGNKLFVGTFGAGIYVFDRADLRFLHHIDLSAVRRTGSANRIHSLIAYHHDSLYAGTDGPLVSINTNNYSQTVIRFSDWNYEHNWVSWLWQGSDKTIYATTNKNKQFYYRKENESVFNLFNHQQDTFFNILTPMYITEDPGGNIWFGGHGASRFNSRTQRFDLLINSFPKIKTARKEINGIAFDKTGNIYYAITENGLSVYDSSRKSFEHITRSNGLPDNSIRALLLLHNKLWLGTESGLASYDIITKKLSAFGISDGMPEGSTTAYQFYYDSVYKKLYGGFVNTIIRFNPDSLAKNNLPPQFFIEHIQVAGDKTMYHPSGQLNISYAQNSLVVHVAAVNFEDAHRQQFAYRIVKTGKEGWQETGSQRSIIFNNLAPGTHRLQLKVYINNNSWSEQVQEIDIIIHPPFWQRWWFVVLCALLLIAGIWYGFRYRIKSIRQKATINAQLAELEMKGLHAQMNPHFIFNCLNSIKEMILLNERQNASRYLSKFAQLIRTNLEQSTRTFITVKECIDQLQQYLDMEKIRLEQLHYQFGIEDELDTGNIQMPPMLLQPLVENAIWHGLHPKQGEKKLAIRFFASGENLICEIEDNGIGIVRSRQNKMELRPDHQSFGIANVRERLNILNEKYKLNCSLSIIDKGSIAGNKESGTLVRLSLTMLMHTT